MRVCTWEHVWEHECELVRVCVYECECEHVCVCVCVRAVWLQQACLISPALKATPRTAVPRTFRGASLRKLRASLAEPTLNT